MVPGLMLMGLETLGEISLTIMFLLQEICLASGQMVLINLMTVETIRLVFHPMISGWSDVNKQIY